MDTATGAVDDQFFSGLDPVAATSRKFVPELRRLGLVIEEGHSRTRQIVGFGLRGDDGDVLAFSRRKVL